jgi:cell division protein FtsN
MNRCTTWTEYSTAKPVDMRHAMDDSPLRVTPKKHDNPTTVNCDRSETSPTTKPPTSAAHAAPASTPWLLVAGSFRPPTVTPRPWNPT